MILPATFRRNRIPFGFASLVIIFAVSGAAWKLLPSEQERVPAPAVSVAPLPVRPPRSALRQTSPDSTELLEHNESAYAARLMLHDEEVYVVTPTALFRLGDGETTILHRGDFGHLGTLSADSLLYLREGKVRSLSLDGLIDRELFSLPHDPLYLLAAGPRPVWVSQEDGHHSVATWSAGSVEVLLSTQESLSAPVLHDEYLYFISSADNTWRIGRTSLHGAKVAFTPAHASRTPSMLVAGPDGIYFYDGPDRGVLRVSFDLTQMHPVLENAICSPLTVSSRLVCAHLGGVFDVPHPGSKPRLIALETGGPIASIQATEKTVYWIVDSGKNQLTAKSAPLPAL